MKLELTEKEVKDILLKWAETEWPQAFNEVEFSSSYNRTAIFTREEPVKVEA